MDREVDALLKAALGQLGYSHLRKRTFKAPWSSEVVDHLVYLDWLKNGGEHVYVLIGIRHQDAQEFAQDMLFKFGPSYSRASWKIGNNFSLVGFQLGVLCSWPLPFALYPAEVGVDACAGTIIDSLQDTLRPLVEGINDDSSMYDFLTQTEIRAMRPLNGAVHAAEVLFIGRRLGYSQHKVASDIEPFLPTITSQIDQTMTVEDYLAQVWAHA